MAKKYIQFKGDLNNDGRITMLDVPLCLRAASSMFDDNGRGDVDGDGTTSIEDVKLIMAHLNGENLIDGVMYFDKT